MTHFGYSTIRNRVQNHTQQPFFRLFSPVFFFAFFFPYRITLGFRYINVQRSDLYQKTHQGIVSVTLEHITSTPATRGSMSKTEETQQPAGLQSPATNGPVLPWDHTTQGVPVTSFTGYEIKLNGWVRKDQAREAEPQDAEEPALEREPEQAVEEEQ